MNINSINHFIEKTWNDSAIPALMDYITIPAVSPMFDRDWKTAGHLSAAVRLGKDWFDRLGLDRARAEIIEDEGRTPVLMIEIEASTPDHPAALLFYGHLDKQPPAGGWDSNKGPWQPVLENNRLYGRGGADDGYALFCALTAIKALQTHQIPHGRCVILIETCEESGSLDLEYYLERLKHRIGSPGLVICLDSGCGDNERMWVTTSLRGNITGELKVRILTRSIHSGASGRVASSFRIIRQLLDRIEDPMTGELKLPELYCPVPERRLAQIQKTAGLLGHTIISSLPLVDGASPASPDPVELILNSSWKPALSCTAAGGLPPMDQAANAIREYTRLMLSIRTPPGLDTLPAVVKLKTLLEKNPPYGAMVGFKVLKHSRGWNMPEMGTPLETGIAEAAQISFGREPGFCGEGGSIPFMTLLQESCPNARFLVTGVLGPDANAHGPNESLDIPYVKKLTQALSLIIPLC